MPKPSFRSVDEYVASHPAATQTALRRVRTVLQKALPGAEEVISYQIAAYKVAEGPVLYFAGWKQHYSLYPASAEIVAALQEELAPYLINKGTIRFPLDEKVPAALIRRIAVLRLAEVTAKKNTAKKKTAKKKTAKKTATRR